MITVKLKHNNICITNTSAYVWMRYKLDQSYGPFMNCINGQQPGFEQFETSILTWPLTKYFDPYCMSSLNCIFSSGNCKINLFKTPEFQLSIWHLTFFSSASLPWCTSHNALRTILGLVTCVVTPQMFLFHLFVIIYPSEGRADVINYRHLPPTWSTGTAAFAVLILGLG